MQMFKLIDTAGPEIQDKPGATALSRSNSGQVTFEDM